jgi:hypothetical protein
MEVMITRHHWPQSLHYFLRFFVFSLAISTSVSSVTKKNIIDGTGDVATLISYDSIVKIDTGADNLHLAAGPKLTWSRDGNIGYSPFALSESNPAGTSYDSWLIKAEANGDRFSKDKQGQFIRLGDSIRLESIHNKGLLKPNDKKSPYSTIFTGCSMKDPLVQHPNGEIFSMLSLSDMANGIGDAGTNWRVEDENGQTGSNGTIVTNTLYCFKNSDGYLAAPRYRNGHDPNFGQGFGVRDWERDGIEKINSGDIEGTIEDNDYDNYHGDNDPNTTKGQVSDFGRVHEDYNVDHHIHTQEDRDISRWNGHQIFRFTTDDTKYYHGITNSSRRRYHKRLGYSPWRLPKAEGSNDGSFESNKGLSEAFEISKRRGGPNALTKFKIVDVVSRAKLVRSTLRGNAADKQTLNDIFGIDITPVTSIKAGAINHSDRPGGAPSTLKYGGLVRLRHKESTNVLASEDGYSYQDGSQGQVVVALSDRDRRSWWMIKGEDSGVRFGMAIGTPLDSNHPIRLEHVLSAKNLRATDNKPPITADFVADSSIKVDLEVSVGGSDGVGSSADNWTFAKSGDDYFFHSKDLGGSLCSVDKVCFPTRWDQEVTLFYGGQADVTEDGYGAWQVERYIDPPSTEDEFKAVNIDFKKHDGVRLVSVTMGNGGIIYGVTAAGKGVKFDPDNDTVPQEIGVSNLKQIAIGQDDTMVFLFKDGTVKFRPTGGSDTAIPGNYIAVGVGTKDTILLVKGSLPNDEHGMLVNFKKNNLLGTTEACHWADISEDGMGIAAQVDGDDYAYRSQFVRTEPGASDSTIEGFSPDQDNDKLVKISVGSRRFMVAQGENRGIYRFTHGEDLFNDYATLLSGWDSLGVKVIDSSIGAEGILAVLGGQPNEAGEYQVFTKNLAPWPKENKRFSIKPVTTQGADVRDRGYLYARFERGDKFGDNGYLRAADSSGKNKQENATDENAQFNMLSYAGYVGLKVGHTSRMNLAVEPPEPVANIDNATLLQQYMQVGFFADKFDNPLDPESNYEKFVFFSIPNQPNHFKLKSVVTGGYLRLDDDGMVRTYDKDANRAGNGVPITAGQATVFEIEFQSDTQARITELLKVGGALNGYDEIKKLFYAKETYRDTDSFLAGVLKYVQRQRRTARRWMDFVDSTRVFTDDAGVEYQRSTAEALRVLFSEESIAQNKYIANGLATNVTWQPFIDSIVELTDPTNVPSDIGVVENLRPDMTIALSISGWGFDMDGNLTDEPDDIVQDLYLVYDKESKLLKFQAAIPLSKDSQFTIGGGPVDDEENWDKKLIEAAYWKLRTSKAETARLLTVPTVTSGAARSIKRERSRFKAGKADDAENEAATQLIFHQGSSGTMKVQSVLNKGFLRVGNGEFGDDTIDAEDQDYYLRSVNVETLQALVEAEGTSFEFVIINKLLEKLTKAAAMEDIAERAQRFAELFEDLETMDEVERFIEALNYFQERTHRVSEEEWNKFVMNRTARNVLLKLVDRIKERFALEYDDGSSLIREFTDRLYFNVTVTPKRNVMTLGKYISKFYDMLLKFEQDNVFLTNFVITDQITKTVLDFTKAVRLWEQEVASKGHQVVSSERSKLEDQLAKFKKKLAVNLAQAHLDRIAELEGRLKAVAVSVDPIESLEEMVTNYLTFSPDDKGRFIQILDELYVANSSIPESTDDALSVMIKQAGGSSDDVEERLIHGLKPSHIERVRLVLKKVLRPPTDKDPGGQLVDDAQYFRKATSYYNYFVAPTFLEFVQGRMGDLQSNFAQFSTWAMNGDEQGIRNIQNYAVRTLDLAESWDEWKPNKESLVELNSFSVLLMQMEQLLGGNEEALVRLEKLSQKIQDLIDKVDV